MGRVFKNLLENALQAIDTKGTISISLREEEDHAVVRVRDSGPGITARGPAEAFSALFFNKEKGDGARSGHRSPDLGGTGG